MTMQGELAHSGADAPSIGAPDLTDWWHSRSCDELQAIIHRGGAGGEAYFAAVAELERRGSNAEADRRAQEMQAARASSRQRITIVLAALALGLVAGVALIVL